MSSGSDLGEVKQTWCWVTNVSCGKKCAEPRVQHSAAPCYMQGPLEVKPQAFICMRANKLLWFNNCSSKWTV